MLWRDLVRYVHICLLLGFIAAVGVAAEGVFQYFGSEHSLTDRSGPGQLMLFAIVIPSLLWFSWVVAGVSPLQLGARYLGEPRRVLGGFLLMYGVATLTLAIALLILAALGRAEWSESAWEAISPRTVRRTAVALLVVLVLATVEELIFRAFFLRYLRSNDTLRVTIAAVLGSSLIFSLSHLIALPAPWYDPGKIPLLFGLFMIGVLTGTAYVATGSIACSVGIHCGLLGFKVFFRHTGLVNLTPDGSWWLGGSADLRVGPLSWLVLLAMTAAIILARHWLRRRFWVEDAVCPDREASVAQRMAPARAEA